jgi:hypothetical protein
MQIIDMLDHLSLAVTSITQDDVRTVAAEINGRVRDAVNAEVVKLYWKEGADRGIILTPIACINLTKLPDPRRFPIDARPGGILSWVVHNRRHLWLEGVKSTRTKGESLMTPGPPANQDGSPRERTPIKAGYDDLASSPHIDSLVAVPLFNDTGELSGIYSVELGTSGTVTDEFVDVMQVLGQSLARLLWEAEVTARNLTNTGTAVHQFLSSLTAIPVSLSRDFRTCFVARPFLPEFERVEQIVSACVREEGIRASAYRPVGPALLVIQDIVAQIRGSHFGVVDITGATPNVMSELGMMIMHALPFILLRRKGDKTSLPFDISMYPVHDYELDTERGNLWVSLPARKRAQPFDTLLATFIEQLPDQIGYRSAREWRNDDLDPRKERAMTSEAESGRP